VGPPPREASLEPVEIIDAETLDGAAAALLPGLAVRDEDDEE
jgi:hypothetical protein